MVPDVTFERNYTLTLGGKTVELLYLGPNHGDCLTVMLIPDAKILFEVGLAAPGMVRGAGGRMYDTSPTELIRTLKEIEETDDFERYMPGHGPAIASKAAMTEVRGYLEALMEAVRRALAAGTLPAEVPNKIDLPDYRHFIGYDQDMRHNAERIVAYYVTGN